MWATVKIKGRSYDVSYSTDTLIPENVKYVDHAEVIAYTPKGTCFVTSSKIMNKVVEQIEV